MLVSIKMKWKWKIPNTVLGNNFSTPILHFYVNLKFLLSMKRGPDKSIALAMLIYVSASSSILAQSFTFSWLLLADLLINSRKFRDRVSSLQLLSLFMAVPTATRNLNIDSSSRLLSVSSLIRRRHRVLPSASTVLQNPTTKLRTSELIATLVFLSAMARSFETLSRICSGLLSKACSPSGWRKVLQSTRTARRWFLGWPSVDKRSQQYDRKRSPSLVLQKFWLTRGYLITCRRMSRTGNKIPKW